MTELTFEKKGTNYYAEFTTTGACVVQIDQKTSGHLNCLASIGDMDGACVFSKTGFQNKNQIFYLDFPEGVNITLESATAVNKCCVL